MFVPSTGCVVVVGNVRETPVTQLVRIVDLTGLDNLQNRFYNISSVVNYLCHLVNNMLLYQSHQTGQHHPIQNILLYFGKMKSIYLVHLFANSITPRHSLYLTFGAWSV